MAIRCAATALVCVVLACAAAPACAQGGPPMLTDDPGTPGDGHWEINIAAFSNHAGDTTTYWLPLVDANYGLGERLQLKFEMPWVLQQTRGGHDESGAGNSLAGVKWRFFDAGDGGWKMSIYPQVQSRFPFAAAAVSAGGVSYLLPLEFEHKIGDWGVNFDIGRWLRPALQGDSWIGGIAIGRDLAKGLEVVGELHDETSVHSGRSEVTLNFGARWKLSERYTLLLSAGSDLQNDLEEKSTLLTYVGLQVHL